jgi:hypothetical protein
MFNDNEDEDGEDLTSAKQFAARMPLPLATGGGQQLPGRTRRCAFWISAFVPDNTFYLMDTTQMVKDAAWTHNPAGDAVPEDTILVIINSRYEQHIRKAMATWEFIPGPAWVAARMIDQACRRDIALPGRLRWKVIQ